jgi:hypothetical protein
LLTRLNSFSRRGLLRELLAPNSTQGDEAVEWLADTDPAMLPLSTSFEIFRNRFALFVFYYSTNGPAWVDKTNWLSNSSVCDWIGVSCTSDFVTSLDFGKLLEHHNVRRMLHLLSLAKTEFESLTIIVVIFFPCTILFPADIYYIFSGNGLSGSIPTEIGLLTMLTYLDFGDFVDFGELLDSKVASTPLLLPVSLQFLFCGN